MEPPPAKSPDALHSPQSPSLHSPIHEHDHLLSSPQSRSSTDLDFTPADAQSRNPLRPMRRGRGPSHHARRRSNLDTYFDSLTDAELELLTAKDHYDDDCYESDDYGVETYERRSRARRRERLRGRLDTLYRSYSRLRWWIWGGTATGLVVLVLIFLGLKELDLGRRVENGYVSGAWYPTPRGGALARWAESYGKAQELVREMTLVEKVNVTTGTGWRMGLCMGNTGPASAVGFPALCLQDGPLGLRGADHVTAFPAGLTTGATWNRELMRRRGDALGLEARMKGVNVVLGPSMGPLGMMPAGGRNWEGFGSDPVLQGVAASETIQGIQGHGVMATAKHYVMNEQEHFRQAGDLGSATAVSSNVDDRALHEVFLWPFAESVRADVASVMCSYQMVNHSYACENSKLLNGILKDELGFQGFVQSDWLAQRSGVQSALGGLDMSMPGDGLHWADGVPLWGNELTRSVLNTSVPMDRLNDMVTRIVAAWYHLGQDSWPRPPPDGDGGPNFSSWTDERVGRLHEGSDDDSTGVVNQFVDARGEGPHAHRVIARQIAAEGTVLLKNEDDTLPLSRDGSPDGVYRVGVYGEDAGPGRGPNACPDRGCNQGTLASGWGSGAVDFPYLVSPLEALQSAWKEDRANVTAYLENEVNPADPKDKDLCLVFVNADSGEGYIESDGMHGDRNDLFVQKGGAQEIITVAETCGNGQGRTVVVVHSVGPVVVQPWIDLSGVHALLFANLPGQESGNALVDVLFGEVDASGRLPYTIGKSQDDYGPAAQVLYETNTTTPQMNFTDGLYIDYRHFDRHNITPEYEFGFGLSYTTFELSGLNVQRAKTKSSLPDPRPENQAQPPEYDNEPPSSLTALFPRGFTKLSKYIYPYLTTLEGTLPGDYQYPYGYNQAQPPSAAGGGAGGNPALYETVADVRVNVTNTGRRSGYEVVQMYVSFPAATTERHGLGLAVSEVEFPERVLRNFTKVHLQPGESREVQMGLSRKDLSYWSVWRQNWVMAEGKYRVWVGRSSRRLDLVGEL
ncbi:hypothetical protein PHISP_07565 [Aspergillus sp. HF37]|nr:hypothetical protein PHISP_07565 [Aspergillus sp. HF37]